MTFFPANPVGRVKCLRYQPIAPGSLLLVLTRVMLISCGTFVVVHVPSSKAVACAPETFPDCTFQPSSIRILMRLLRYLPSRRSVMFALVKLTTRKTVMENIVTRHVLNARTLSFLPQSPHQKFFPDHPVVICFQNEKVHSALVHRVPIQGIGPCLVVIIR